MSAIAATSAFAAPAMAHTHKHGPADAGASAPSAASPQLQAIAQCESGGDPTAIGGGGAYRGKYQFDYRPGLRSAVAATPLRRRRPSRTSARRSCSRRAAPRRGRSAARSRDHELNDGPGPGAHAPGPFSFILGGAPLLGSSGWTPPPCAPSSRCSSDSPTSTRARTVRFPRARSRPRARSSSARSRTGACPPTSKRRGELSSALREAYARRLGVEHRRRRAHLLHVRGARRSWSRAWPSDAATRSSPPTRSTRACSAPCRPRATCAARASRSRRSRDVHEAVGPATRLVATSHVSWVGGELAPAELRELDVPVLLDGAQGVGAIPVDPAALGADAYAGAGQKWLCGPDGTGMLFVSEALRERVASTRRAFVCFADPADGLDAPLQPDARRYQATSQSAEAHAAALAAHEVLDELRLGAGARARRSALAARLADELEQPGARGRAARPDHARLVGQRRPRGRARAARRAGNRDPRHTRPRPAARLRRSVERRARPRTPAGSDP